MQETLAGCNKSDANDDGDNDDDDVIMMMI